MAKDKPYKEGTIKLTWINPSDYKILHSTMFNSVEDALRSLPEGIDPQNFLLFKLVKTDGNYYEWQLLDYGRSKEYVSGMKFKDNKFLYYGTIALIILGAMHIGQLIISKK